MKMKAKKMKKCHQVALQRLNRVHQNQFLRGSNTVPIFMKIYAKHTSTAPYTEAQFFCDVNIPTGRED